MVSFSFPDSKQDDFVLILYRRFFQQAYKQTYNCNKEVIGWRNRNV
jgi:hypothetical protein